MRIARTKAEVRAHRMPEAGFVPTMGALHEGHLEIMRRAKAECGTCAISIFVNPTQFGPQEDFEKYPRDENRDLELAEDAGVDFVFLPSAEEMYGHTRSSVQVADLSELWEGRSRPGHFDGVATVVAKLFHLLQPRAAYFGLKDFQQCAVLKRMVADLDFDVLLRFVETIREPDGLARSSRNQYLSTEERMRAPQLFRAMQECRAEIVVAKDEVARHVGAAKVRLEHEGFRVDYLELVDRDTLNALEKLDREAQLIAAVWLGNTRLIDNCAVEIPR